MNKIIYSLCLSLILLACTNKPTLPRDGKLLVNHLGYQIDYPKQFVFQSKSDFIPDHFELIDSKGKTVFKGKFSIGGDIDAWHTGKGYNADFSEFNTAGRFAIKMEGKNHAIISPYFSIDQSLYNDRCTHLLIEGFKSIHPAKEYEEWDSNIPFHGDRADRVDVSGGWYDASGDFSKYLTHLNYSNYLCPQQTAMVVYNMIEASQKINNPVLKAELVSEASYGADFVYRMFDQKHHYFYSTIFDNWSKDPSVREICAYQTQDGIRTVNYQSAFREGAGTAIAALAFAANNNAHGTFTAEQYLDAAEKGFAHLLEHNLSYCNDGKENIIDEYCALLAAVELFKATENKMYLNEARKRSSKLISLQTSDDKYSGWWSANHDKTRSFFHAADAGLPIISLVKYIDIERNESNRTNAIKAIKKSVVHELNITNDVNNPFGYPRQYVKAVDEEYMRAAFFVPHQNESGYWWQGENARLASLTTALTMAMPYIDAEQKPAAKVLANNCINWILGMNPYDMSMLQGIGRNNPEYNIGDKRYNYDGGIANGITAGFIDETDIAFLPKEYETDYAQNWRWPEQWIPHAGWMIVACSYMQ